MFDKHALSLWLKKIGISYKEINRRSTYVLLRPGTYSYLFYL